MTKEEFATKINGRQEGNELSRQEENEAKSSGLVIIFGASDDLMEVRGSIHDEAGCYNSGEVPFTRKGIPQNDCHNSDCPYFRELVAKMPKIKAIWHDADSEYSWTYETIWPVAEFDIFTSDKDKYCRGIVFDLASIPAAAGAT